MPKPRIVLFDIETSNLNANFGYCLCAGWKVLGEKKTHVIKITDFSLFKQDPTNDKMVIKEIAKVLTEADGIIGHYSRKFDYPFIQTRLINHGLPIMPDMGNQHIDTWRICRYKLKLNSNRLATAAAFLGVEEKTPLSGPIWIKAQAGHKPSLKYVYEHCTTPNYRTLTKDLKWKQLGDLKVGDELIAFEEKNSISDNRIGRRYTTSIVEKIAFDKQPVFSVQLSSGEEFLTTGDHRWLVCNSISSNTAAWKWLETNKMRFKGEMQTNICRVIPLFKQSQEYNAGWLAGILDGEGTVSGRTSISFGQRPGIVLDKACSLLEKYAYPYNLKLTNLASHTGIGKKDCITVHINGSLPDRLALLGTLRPERLINRLNPEIFGRLERRNRNTGVTKEIYKVENISSVGIREIIKIKTSSRTLFIEGYPMHNCKQDVIVLEQVYDKIKAIETTSHFNVALPTAGKSGKIGLLCPRCGSETLEKRGFRYAKVQRTQRYCCKSCGAWSNGKAQTIATIR